MDTILLHPSVSSQIKFVSKWLAGLDLTSMHKDHTFPQDLRTIVDHSFRDIHLQINSITYAATIKVLNIELNPPTHQGKILTPINCIKFRISYKSCYGVEFGIFIHRNLNDQDLTSFPYTTMCKDQTNTANVCDNFVSIGSLSDYNPTTTTTTSKFYIYSPVSDFFKWLANIKNEDSRKHMYTPNDPWLKTMSSGSLSDYGTKLLYFDGSNLFQLYKPTYYSNQKSGPPRLIINTALIPIMVGSYDHVFEMQVGNAVRRIKMSELSPSQRRQLGLHRKNIYYYIINGQQYIIRPTDRMSRSHPIVFDNESGTVDSLTITSEAYLKRERFLSTLFQIDYSTVRDHGNKFTRKDIVEQPYNKFSATNETLHYKYALYMTPKIIRDQYTLPRLYNIITRGKIGKNIKSVKPLQGTVTVYLFANIWKFISTVALGLESPFYEMIDKYMAGKYPPVYAEDNAVKIFIKESNEFTLPNGNVINSGRGDRVWDWMAKLNKYVQTSIQRLAANRSEFDKVSLVNKWHSIWTQIGVIADPAIAKKQEDLNINIFLSTFTGVDHFPKKKTPSNPNPINDINDVRMEYRQLIQNYHEHMLFMHMDKYIIDYNKQIIHSATPSNSNIYWNNKVKAESVLVWTVKLVLFILGLAECTKVDEVNTKQIITPNYRIIQSANQRVAERTHLMLGNQFTLHTSVNNLITSLSQILSFVPIDITHSHMNVVDMAFSSSKKSIRSRTGQMAISLDEKSQLAQMSMLTKYYTDVGTNTEIKKQAVYGSGVGFVDPLDASEDKSAGKNKALALGTFISRDDDVNLVMLIHWIHNLITTHKFKSKDTTEIIIMIDSIYMGVLTTEADPTIQDESDLSSVANQLFNMKSLIPEIRLISVTVDESLYMINLYQERGRMCKLFARPTADLSKYENSITPVEDAIKAGDCIYLTNKDNFMYMYPSNLVYALNEPVLSPDTSPAATPSSYTVISPTATPSSSTSTATSPADIKMIQRFEAPSAYVNDLNLKYGYRTIWTSDWLGVILIGIQGVNQTSLARATYGSNMEKQSLAEPAGMDNTNFKFGIFGSRPSVSSIPQNVFGNFYAGFNMLASLVTHHGLTQEDSKAVSSSIYGLGWYDVIFQSTQQITHGPTGHKIPRNDLERIFDKNRAKMMNLDSSGSPIEGRIYDPNDVVFIHVTPISHNSNILEYIPTRAKLKFPAVLIRKSERNVGTSIQIKLIFRSYVYGQSGVKGVDGPAQKGQTVASPPSEMPCNDRGIRITYARSIHSIPSRMTASDAQSAELGNRSLYIGKPVVYDTCADPNIIYDLVLRIPDNTQDVSDEIEELSLANIKAKFNSLQSHKEKWEYCMRPEIVKYVSIKADELSRVIKVVNPLTQEYDYLKLAVFPLKPIHHIGSLKIQVSQSSRLSEITGRKFTGTDKAARLGHMEISAILARFATNVMKSFADQAGRVRVRICPNCIIPIQFRSDAEQKAFQAKHGRGVVSNNCITCKRSLMHVPITRMLLQFFLTQKRFLITGTAIQASPKFTR